MPLRLRRFGRSIERTFGRRIVGGRVAARRRHVGRNITGRIVAGSVIARHLARDRRSVGLIALPRIDEARKTLSEPRGIQRTTQNALQRLLLARPRPVALRNLEPAYRLRDDRSERLAVG